MLKQKKLKRKRKEVSNVVFMLLAHIVGQILSTDLIHVQKQPDRVTYTYRTVGLVQSEAIQKLKATLMSLLNYPMDIPTSIRVYPEKKGLVFKSYIVEVDVKPREFKLY